MTKQSVIITVTLVVVFFAIAVEPQWVNTTYADSLEDIIQTVEDFDSPYSDELINLLREFVNCSIDDYSKIKKISTSIGDIIDKLTPEQQAIFYTDCATASYDGGSGCSVEDCGGWALCVPFADEVRCLCDAQYTEDSSGTVTGSSANPAQIIQTQGGSEFGIVVAKDEGIVKSLAGLGAYCTANCVNASCTTSSALAVHCLCWSDGYAGCYEVTLKSVPIISPLGLLLLIISITGISVFTLKRLLRQTRSVRV